MHTQYRPVFATLRFTRQISSHQRLFSTNIVPSALRSLSASVSPSRCISRLSLLRRHIDCAPSTVGFRDPVSRMRTSMSFATDSTAGSTAPSNLPLAGIRVLDMTRVLAGILGDMGAEIIKIEHPVRGDDTRAWGPPYATNEDPEDKEIGESAYFLCANRNKKSVALSFATPDGVAILYDLIRKSDVLVENYLPGSLAKYGLDYATVAEINPRIIYASITGYGQTGPYSHRAGYDVMVEAEFGLMHITGARDGPAVKVGVAVTDLTTGLYASNAVMAAIIGRSISGKGVHIDISLSDCQTATLANIASSVLISGKSDTGRWGTAHPSIVPYESFPTSDGSVLLGAGNDRLFSVLSTGLGQGDWPEDERYATNASRVQHRVELVDKINDITRTQSTQFWMDQFSTSGLPCAPINDVKTALELDHTKARGMIKTLNHSRCGEIKVVNTPIKMTQMYAEDHISVQDGRSSLMSPPASPCKENYIPCGEQGEQNQQKSYNGSNSHLARSVLTERQVGGVRASGKSIEKPIEAPLGARFPPPLLGQHTQEVLSSIVGLRSEQITSLVDKGVVYSGRVH